jgi:hypothetical protein
VADGWCFRIRNGHVVSHIFILHVVEALTELEFSRLIGPYGFTDVWTRLDGGLPGQSSNPLTSLLRLKVVNVNKVVVVSVIVQYTLVEVGNGVPRPWTKQDVRVFSCREISRKWG